MRSLFTFLTLLISGSIIGQSLSRKVLFLGNSYTAVNDLPKLVADVARSCGDTLIYDSHLIGGYTLDQHFDDSISLNKIKAGGWDYVVLQDQSQVPAFPDYSGEGGSNLCRWIQQYNSCSRPMFYMTWGRKNGDQDNCSSWPPICTYEGMDSMLHRSYMELAAANHADVSPVGAVWKYIRQNFPLLELYQPDESHPSVFGSYIAACSFYASIFKKDPTLITYNAVLPSSEANLIKSAARHIVFDSLPSWHFPSALPSASFYYSIGNGINEVKFMNTSRNAETYLWNFGDGSTSNSKYPTHYFQADGSYTITLTASSCDLEQIQDSAYQIQIRFCPFNPVIVPDTVVLCLNSTDTLWTQVYDSYQWLDEYGVNLPGETNRFLHVVGGGNYAVQATRNGCSERSPESIVNVFHSLQSFYVDIIGNVDPHNTFTNFCQGDSVKLVLTPNKPPYPDDNNIEWFKDGLPIPYSKNDTLVIRSAGNYYVQLKDTGYCPGTIIYTSPPTILDATECSTSALVTSIVVYPNPSDGNFAIKVPASMIGTYYAVYDIIGQQVVTGKLETEVNHLRLGNMPNGVYVVRFNHETADRIKLLKTR